MRQASDVMAVVLLCLVGTVWPSVLSALYFVIFLGLVLWWSIYKPVKRRALNAVKFLLIFYSGLHLIIIYLYQLHFFQTFLDPSSLIAR